MPIEKITNMMPVSASGCSLNRQNAMKFRFAAFNISSIPMSTMIALRRVNAPASPMPNSSVERTRYAASGVMWRSSGISFPLLLSHRNDHRADQRSGQQQADHFQRQHELVHQRVADLADAHVRLRRHVRFVQNAALDRPEKNAQNPRDDRRTGQP